MYNLTYMWNLKKKKLIKRVDNGQGMGKGDQNV